MLTVLSATLRVVWARTGALFIRRQQSPLTLEAATGGGVDALAPPFETTVVGQVARENRPVLLQEGRTLVPGESSALVMPMSVGGNWVGVIYLGRAGARAFRPEDLTAVGALNEVSALAIDGLEQAHHQSHSWMLDAETGLYSEQYFSERVREERKRNKRYKRRALLMTFSIEGAGAEAPAALSELIMEHVRETDIAARLAPSKFSVLLVEAPEKESRKIAERIELAIERQFKGVTPVTVGLTVL
jgi:GGDEF domain-containing protein